MFFNQRVVLLLAGSLLATSCGGGAEAEAEAGVNNQSAKADREQAASCQNQPAFPNPHREGDPRHMRHKTCLHYVDVIPGIVAYSEKPEFYQPEIVRMNLGIPEETRGSIRERILGKALNMAYAGDPADTIERGIFCDCLGASVDSFDDDTAPIGEVAQARQRHAEYAARSCDEQMEGLARAAMMRYAQGRPEDEVFEYVADVVGEDRAITFIEAMLISEDDFDDVVSSYHARGCR